MNRMQRNLVLGATCVAALALQPRPADACGGGFFGMEATIDSKLDAQRTLLVYDGTATVRHYVQVSYTGSPKEFAWVYPLPTNPEPPVAVDDGEALFARLDALTAPQFHVQVLYPDSGGGGGGGCLCGSTGDDAAWRGDGDAGADGAGDGVTIWDGGRVGIFDYVVITAATIDPLMTWLTDNGFLVPAAASPVLEHYVAGGFYFVAMKINPEAAGVVGAGSTSTILLRYPASERVYPLHMASLGAAESTSVLLYVLAEHRVETAAPYPTARIDSTQLEVSGTEPNFSVNYEDVFATTVARLGGRAFITEYVGEAPAARRWSTTLADLPGGFAPRLTRLRTTLGPDRMTDDVELVDAATDDAVSRDFHFTVEVVLARGTSATPDILLALAVPSLILLVTRFRKRSW